MTLWTHESRTLRERAYALGDRRLSWRYGVDFGPSVELRIEQAGRRLLGLFNRTLGTQLGIAVVGYASLSVGPDGGLPAAGPQSQTIEAELDV